MKPSSFSLLAVASTSFITTTTLPSTSSPPALSPRSNQTASTQYTTLNTTAQTIPPSTILPWCKYTNGMLFLWDLPTFIRHGEAQFSLGQMTWDWTSDGCTSVPTGRPMGVPFTPACQRHDFGYRNFQAQRRFTEGARHKIDDNFSKDMFYQCKKYSHNWVDKQFCKAAAWAYWWAVRGFYNGKGTIQHCPKNDKKKGKKGNKGHAIEMADYVDETMSALETREIDATADAAWAESMAKVYAGMDPDEARDAARHDLPQEKIEEYYQRAKARAEKAEEVARAMGGPNFYLKE